MVAFVNPSMLISAHCTDYSTSHSSGCGAPHGCETFMGTINLKPPSWAVAGIETPAPLKS